MTCSYEPVGDETRSLCVGIYNSTLLVNATTSQLRYDFDSIQLHS